jgi:hypothetical protein
MAQETLQLIITADNKEALKAIEDLAKSTAGLKTKFVEAKGGTDQATQSLVNLSRVAQDAPYGFIGIANNLNPLLESFQRLRASSTSNKEAFQSLLGVMTGPAGIGLALGVISSLMVVFSDKLFGAKKATDEAKKAQEEYAKSMIDAQAKASESGVKLSAYIQIADDITVSDKRRAEALKAVKDELGKVNKEYAASIKTTDDARKAVELYTQALIAEAITNRYKEEIANKQIALNETLKKATVEAKNYSEALKVLNNTAIPVGDQIGKFQRVTDAAVDAQKAYVGTANKAVGLKKDIDDLTGSLNANVKSALDNPFFSFGGSKKGGGGGPENKLSEVQKILKNLQETLNSAEFELLEGIISEKGAKDSYAVKSLEAIYKAIEKIAGSKTQEAQNALKQLLGSAKELEDKYYSGKPQGDVSDLSPVVRDVSFRTTDKFTGGAQKALDPLRTARNEMAINKMIADNDAEGMKKRQKAYENFADTISGMATNAIMGFFDALKNGQNVLEALGDQFLRLAEDIAAAVIKAAIFKAIMTALNASSGGGAGAVAAAANIGVIPFATGGIVTGPTMGLVGEAGPEAIIPLSKLTGMLTKTFSAGSMSSGRGSGGGQFVLRGQDLLLATNRAQKASNLKGQSISLA